MYRRPSALRILKAVAHHVRVDEYFALESDSAKFKSYDVISE